MDERRQRAERIIKEHIIWAIGAGLVPLPLLDIAAVTGIQLDMLKQISTNYGVSYSESEGKVWLSALTGSVFAKLAANAVKLIPGIGSVIGGISMAVISGGSTYALGQVVVNHFESGGTFDDLDVTRARRVYEEEFERGKAFAAKLAEEQKQRKAQGTASSPAPAPAATPAPEASGPPRDVFEKLERLRQLRDKGVIGEDDFTQMKKKLLDQI